MHFRIPLFSGARNTIWNNEELIREELFGPERLEEHARSLAEAQEVKPRTTGGPSLSTRLRENEAFLLGAYRAIAATVEAGHTVTPAAEWVLDNYHIVEEQIFEIRGDLPPGYYRQLPKLAGGPFPGFPRVFGISWAYIAHTDSRFDADLLCRFVDAYQSVQPLTIGELWAIAITLRIVLVENLRRATGRIVDRHALRLKADEIADRVLGVGPGKPATIASLLATADGPLPPTVIVQLAHRLRDLDPRVTRELQWLEQRVEEQGSSIAEVTQAEHQRQAAMNVTVRNIITSMRQISAIDWTELVERVSLVDALLRESGNFAEMDFATRDHYRKAIEKLSRGSRQPELDVTRRAIDAAETSPGDGPDERDRDPGYYLFGDGHRAFERALGYRPPPGDWPRLAAEAGGSAIYIGGILVVAALIAGAMIAALAHFGLGVTLVLLALLAVIPALDMAVAIANRLAGALFRAVPLPALALRGGVPTELRTMVVVPALLSRSRGVKELIERIEVHYLSNQDGDITYALLSDWPDSASEQADSDDALLARAKAGIARLNRRYGRGIAGDRFLLLHRRRQWNASQQKWMGWERKRGKLEELNRLLRGADDTSFIAIDGQAPAVPRDVRYIVTLDSDTRMPRETIRRLVGKMAHVLNRPRLDPRLGRVVQGYGIMQPRVTAALPVGSEGSRFQQLFASSAGIDPYAGAISDVYQDVFDEGIYQGKGIYDVDAFSAALDGRTPESSILSHDLFEGIFARAGLASDIEFVEDFPERYDVFAARLHRWVRGDWQLLPWIFAHPGGSVGKAGAPALGRWKMFDNLRRSLSAPVITLGLLVGFALPPAAALAWTGFLLAALLVPSLLPAFAGLFAVPPRSTLWKHLGRIGRQLGLSLVQAGVLIAILAHQAVLMGDAIGRTLWRLTVSRRRLLEWTTAEQASRLRQRGLVEQYRWMGLSIVVALAALAIAATRTPANLLLALPFVLAWLAAPALVRWLCLVRPDREASELTAEDAARLRSIGRHTWRYFETFVTAEDNHLPPDNFQEDPRPTVAHRTSPTNIGLYLLSVVAARDFGWIGLLDKTERIEATLGTMNRMQRFRGHFYNWYDTTDLRPLDPEYVSSVDSGNLAGHLLVLAKACEEAIADPLLSPAAFAAVGDCLGLTRAALAACTRLSGDGNPRAALASALDALDANLQAHPFGGVDPAATLVGLDEKAGRIVALADAFVASTDEEGASEVKAWAVATRATIESHLRDLALIPDVFAGARDKEERSFPSLGALVALAANRNEPPAAVAAAPSQSSLPAPRSTAGHAAADDPVRALRDRLARAAEVARAMAQSMDFRFLLVADRRLLSIGYLAKEGRLDPNCYDLLASEARLASFFGIAKTDLPVRHWFSLGRSATEAGGGAVLISWSGSMFEYLMPSLVMRAPNGSLLERNNRLVVKCQIAYGAKLGLPWGMSESAYNARDLEFTYQYSNFGVPGLGLKRGLGSNAVIAPYATALAAMVDPSAAVRNFDALALAGGRGSYGFYEALDYTPSRVPKGEKVAVVRAFMAHHQGMSITAIANALIAGAMRRRFHADAMITATELLLQERSPREPTVVPVRAEEVRAGVDVRDTTPPAVRRYASPHTATPATQILSNGRYSIMLTAAGSGYSRWNDLAITRWRADATSDDWGTYFYLRDREAGRVWSAGYQPTAAEPQSYDVTYSEDRVEFVRRDRTIMTTQEVVISGEDDAEARRISLVNMGGIVREIELTSYAELVLAPAAADNAHPAFSKLFVETEYLADLGMLLATRRRRSPGDPPIWAAHFAAVEGETAGEIEFETDRARFIGRGRDRRSPAALDSPSLSNTVGTVLDPVFALRRRVRVPPGATVRVTFWTIVSETREGVIEIAEKYRDTMAFERAATLAWTHAQVQLRHIDLTADAAALFQELAGTVLYSDRALRASADVLARGGRQNALWPHGISGDLPIVLVRLEDAEDIDLARSLVLAHEYWRMKQLQVDLVILNERASSYVQDLQNALDTMVRISQSRSRPGTSGGRIFVLRGDLISPEARDALSVAARAILIGRRGPLADQLERLDVERRPAVPPRAPAEPAVGLKNTWSPQLEFWNGLGGFDQNGREYLTILRDGATTPAPWINVIANPAFGFQVAAEGAGYTWSINSRENQLTPWSNDPVSNRTGEAIYIRDEDSRVLWGPMASPIRNRSSTYVARHGRGYSRFEHTANGVALDLIQFVPLEDPVKISRLTIRNVSGRRRRLSVTAYVEWVLAPLREAAVPFIVTEIELATGAILARNFWSREFGTRTAFLDLGGRQQSWTGDRGEFIGRHGSLAAPAALVGRAALSGRVGAGLDPCAALSAPIVLEPDESTEIVILLGQTASAAEAEALITRYRAADLDAVLAKATGFWDDLLGRVEVTTPDRSLDIMLNGWLLYQALACRMWARSGFYQASGAYGFRDQLQDSMAVAPLMPELARGQILRAAGRQFKEGDVQHWWLPTSGEGVRTRISDDRAWFAYVVAYYVRASGDAAVLDESLPFLEGPHLAEGQHDSFFRPETSESRAPVYEHCALALDASLAVGAHGLPLMGTGDWNDGMNRVGEGGKGESVWLGWFLYAALDAFIPLAQARGDLARVERWRAHCKALQAALERDGWDGAWYRRAYYDDGAPLGSAENEECRIDSIPQSWAVLSKGAEPERAMRAMAAFEAELFRRDEGLALLFTPPFNHTQADPGYIKAYPPGLRENGGQYTHAALWAVPAFAALGEGDKAAALFAMLNPINHSDSIAAVARYKVEPYVVVADVYSAPQHVGRGGWTWYTGSAAWMHRAGVESILGLRREAEILIVDPCIPRAWPGFKVRLRHGSASYEISVENPDGVNRGIRTVELDGTPIAAPYRIPLASDTAAHRIRVVLGPES